GQMDERAGELAARLRSKGIKPNTIAALMVERTIEMLVAIFGIVKAGGAYLPIDPGYPADRIEYILQDSNAKLLLTMEKEKTKAQTLATQPELLYIDNVHKKSRETASSENIYAAAPETKPTDLLYVIYTSGSTGRPKGVMIEHRALSNQLNWIQKEYPIGAEDTILYKTTYTFDVSVWEIFWWAVTGARLAILDHGWEKEPLRIVETVVQTRVTVMIFVPSMLRVFLENINTPAEAEKLNTLKQIITIGEALEVSLVKEFNRLVNNSGKILLTNTYGPTEATIAVSNYDCPAAGEITHIPIGKPMDNIGLYVLGVGEQLQPVGVPGELCIAGDGLARGYINKPELTAERFPVTDNQLSPYFTNNHLYHTGDLARWLPDGNVQYLGRMDHQVKIRGNRIELGEIEAVLERYATVKQAVVAPVKGKTGGISLCAYYADSQYEKETDVAALREHLSKHLPDYMVPSYYVKLEEIPVSSNGKINRKALPQPGVEDIIRDETRYREPRNDLQVQMVAVWQEVLGLERIGIDDSFIDIGGDSIQAIQITSRLNRVGYKLEIAHIFKHLTI
ncbi:MAG: amino acid adenylation domain-containing protein, partial [bacterium]|nr:amino acid adenylation domain-containing protein [bacterium]